MQPRILLVDDEPQVTAALTRALRREAYDVLTANSAVEALRVLQTVRVDVIVSDEQMPGMVGSELLAIVRRDYPETARIILTGHASLEAAVRAINEGEIYRFLTKPCNTNDLTTVIEQALQQKESTGEGQIPPTTTTPHPVVLRKLERESPGITRINKDATGAIILEDTPLDLGTLMQTIKAAAEMREAYGR